MGFLNQSKQALKKTAQLLRTDIRDLFKGEGRLVDDVFCEELYEKFIRTDMGVEAAQELVDEIRANFRTRIVQMNDVLDWIKAKLKVMMNVD